MRDHHEAAQPAPDEGIARLARRYADAYEKLAPDTLDALCALVAEDVRFRDPFSDFKGRARLAEVFRHMFEGLTQPAFTVSDIACSGRVAYLRWAFTFAYRGHPYRIEGMSEVHFGEDGLVTSHLDHWDSGSQVYLHIPVLGRVIAFIRRKLAG
jgi:steroid delta-isomerase